MFSRYFKVGVTSRQREAMTQSKQGNKGGLKTTKQRIGSRAKVTGNM